MQEMPEDSERQRQMQAPNRAEVWSRSQESRERAMSGPRFEQTMMQFQVRGLSAPKCEGSLGRENDKESGLRGIWYIPPEGLLR